MCCLSCWCCCCNDINHSSPERHWHWHWATATAAGRALISRKSNDTGGRIIAHRSSCPEVQRSRSAEAASCHWGPGKSVGEKTNYAATMPGIYLFQLYSTPPPPRFCFFFFFYCSRLSSLMPELELSFSLDIDWVAMRLMCCDINLVFGVAKRAMHCDSQKFSR